MAAPVGVSKEIIQRLSTVMMEALNDKPVQDQFRKAGIPSLPMSAEHMSRRVTDETKWITEMMTELGMAKK